MELLLGTGIIDSGGSLPRLSRVAMMTRGHERIATLVARTHGSVMIVHESRKQVTTLLGEIQAGNDEANNLLFTLVYEELTQLAGQLMRGERHGHTLEPTALVNEAVLRLLDQDVLEQTRNRAHFFGTAARAMRQILVDHARSRAARKRGGAAQRVPLDSVLDRLNIRKAGRGFGTLRHTFRTWADETLDQHAVDHIMGHKLPGVRGRYVKQFEMTRLRAVTDHVRAKVFD